MKEIKSSIVFFMVLGVILFIFRSWFLPLSLSTGDWSYKFPRVISQFQTYPFAWDLEFKNGLGGNTIFLLALNTYYHATIVFLTSVLHIPWIVVEKILWFWPYLLISFPGSFLLFRRLFGKNSMYAVLSSLIFMTNTYALMITGGGQMGVVLGYGMIPFVVWGFVGTLEEQNHVLLFKRSILAGLLFAVQLLFDLRIAYVTLVLLGAYYIVFLFRINFFEKLKKTFLSFAVIPGLVIAGLHFFWLFPFAAVGQNPLSNLGETFTSIGILKFLSFATFENTISLLHPNWPDNLFGKVQFMRPEFLILPILAFLSLLFAKKENTLRIILSVSFIGLLGTFLAKGTGEPFGGIYIWLFQKIPGFMMFRDSSKWYGLVAVSFSLLIPYTLLQISNKKYPILNAKFKKSSTFYIQHSIIIIFLLFWILTIRQSFLSELRGTFAPRNSPAEYFKLSEFLGSQNTFFRTLWFPGLHQYSYTSVSHPAIPGGDFLSAYSNKAVLNKMAKHDTSVLIDDAAVKYVIVPSDTEGKLFTTDRKYDAKKYLLLVSGLEKNPALKKVHQFGRIIVFENTGYKNHLWIDGQGKISFTQISPVLYQARVYNAGGSSQLIFSENYDPNWIAVVDGKVQRSQKYKIFNSFRLSSGNSTVKIYYKPQDYINFSIPVSIAAGILILIILAYPVKGGKT